MRLLIYTLIVSVTISCTPQSGRAMLAPVQSAPAMDSRASDIKVIQAALESKIVRERMKDLGMSEKEIDSRLSQLSSQEVHQLAKNIETLNSGGSLGGLLVLTVLVLLIIYLAKRI